MNDKREQISPNRLKEAALKSGFKVFTKPYDLTLIGLRNPAQKSNAFDDALCVLYHNASGMLKLEMFTCTTDPGLYWLQNPMKKQGTAIMLSGQQWRGCYQLMDKGHKGRPAFRQVKPMGYVRDNNLDGMLNFELANNASNVFQEIIGSHIHEASKTSTSTTVGKWSAGCQVVAEQTEWQRLLQLGRLQMANGHGDRFSYGILNLNSI